MFGGLPALFAFVIQISSKKSYTVLYCILVKLSMKTEQLCGKSKIRYQAIGAGVICMKERTDCSVPNCHVRIILVSIKKALCVAKNVEDGRNYFLLLPLWY